MGVLDTLFFSLYVNNPILSVAISVFAFFLGLFFNDPNSRPNIKFKIFGICYMRILTIFSFLVFSFILSLFVYFGLATVEKDEVKRFIDNGYINSGASLILINKINKESIGKPSSDLKKYEKITYYKLALSIIEDRNIRKANDFNIESEKVIKLLESSL